MSASAFLTPTPVFLSRPAARDVTASRRTTLYTPANMSLASDMLDRARADTVLLAQHSGKALSVLALAAALALPLDPASAASGGGRVGGSSFRRSPPAASRSYSSPRMSPPIGSYGGGGGYGYGYGGGYGGGVMMPSLFFNPFLAPVGGGGLGSFLLFAGAAAFLLDAVQKKEGESEFAEAADPVTAVTVLKVGLLATARGLQMDLDSMGRSADTSSVAGLRYVLDQTVTSLLRNPDFWMYGSVDVKRSKLSKAESEFDRVCLEERLKLDEETLSNTAGRKREAARASAREADLSKSPGEYIVVSLVVAAAGDLVTKMPKSIESTGDVNRALRALAGVTADSLQGVEVIWAPQSTKDTLTRRELLADHPELKQL